MREKTVSFKIDADLFEQLKIKCRELNVDMDSFIEAAVRKEFIKEMVKSY